MITRILWTVLKLKIQSSPNCNEAEMYYNSGQQSLMCACAQKHMYAHVYATCTPWTMHVSLMHNVHTCTCTCSITCMFRFLYPCLKHMTVNCCFITDHFNKVFMSMIVLKAAWQPSVLSYLLWEAHLLWFSFYPVALHGTGFHSEHIISW